VLHRARGRLSIRLLLEMQGAGQDARATWRGHPARRL